MTKTIIDRLAPHFGKPGLSTRRAIDESNVREAMKLIRRAKHSVRVYSDAGFVANSYRSRCEIQYVEATKNEETGKWLWRTGWSGAQRRNGYGPLVTIDGRAK